MDPSAPPGAAPRGEDRTAPPFVEVAVPVPLRQTFTYRVPPELRGRLELGSQVKVPFGRRRVTGFVLGFSAWTGVSGIKDVAGAEDPELSLPAEILDLCRWVSDYYLAPIGEVLRAALPAGLGKKTPGEVPHAEGKVGDIVLDRDQQRALDALEGALAGGAGAFLLYGVTGSGKTEVYLRAAASAVARGKTALVLIPEIALSPQMVGRVEARFGSRVALWHSALTPTQRRSVWARTRRGEIDVLVGARSAVFAPLPNLGLIVVDEEHEGAYKQSESPRYHARDTAMVRARNAGAVVVLGSATPSLESHANAVRGKYTLLELPRRVAGRARSRVRLVEVPRREPGKPRPVSTVFSDPLRDALSENLSRGEQTILFLNRRGFSTVVRCEECNEPVGCSQCDIVMTWHAQGDRLVCHYCGRRQPRPEQCPACGEPVLLYKGVGTQRVEHELARLYPTARIHRLDTDSTRKRGALEEALDAFRRGELDVLLGTQMVAKGLDFPNVTLVGVVNADLQLALPDFRSAERTFQLMTQVAGRSGRGERPGRVLIQTNHPDHYALTAAAAQDYEAFFRREFAERRDPPYPPHRRLVNLLFDGRSHSRVTGLAERIAERLEAAAAKERLRVEILGPAPQPLSRLKGMHRWHITLRGSRHRDLRKLAEAALDERARSRSPVRVGIDVDPVSML